MARIRVEANAVIDAPAAKIYTLLADYREGHPHILPKRHFSVPEIESGGYGEGTIFRVRVRALGVEQGYRMLVSEPEPGQMLVETDTETGLVTTFTVTPEGDNRARLRIATEWTAQAGFAGLLERWCTPPVMRRIYTKELRQVAEYFWLQRSTSQTPTEPLEE